MWSQSSGTAGGGCRIENGGVRGGAKTRLVASELALSASSAWAWEREDRSPLDRRGEASESSREISLIPPYRSSDGWGIYRKHDLHFSRGEAIVPLSIHVSVSY
ncbi:hypothetical protein E2562_008842 [Oryza meyeriana var. granulata]|uniref:Uncharacterized protein n=1 Tax=Oryza meyeriana var. granulata TaxID=110450 RepID=A0A6G1D095_9ORYZ|nr:hypothetical protein E2562_008842 [Oryza meyeriana var. granulata]